MAKVLMWVPVPVECDSIDEAIAFLEQFKLEVEQKMRHRPEGGVAVLRGPLDRAVESAKAKAGP